MSAVLVEKAPAKLNLTLHVRGRREDGWHDLESLVAFAGAGDLLTLEPADGLALEVEGPTAAACGPADDNLVMKAARALAQRVPGLRAGRFRLLKRLPAAAGLGGGSSDAAAALRLLARLNGLAGDDPRVFAAAAATGSDVPVCLDPRARMMLGRGDDVGPRIFLPRLFAVLVNPGVALETARVFGRIGLAKGEASGFGPHPAIGNETFDALIPKLRRARNDMEDAACALAPVVGDVLAVLGAAPGAKLARMSGSGATCFALFADCRTAARAARAIAHGHPGWWAKASALR
ncbi:MAG: 4-diphosphocytidyl-2-C-methyl-D-erythritol kinase [Hyphomicrobiales bacterium]|nr:4-diphosphocytidyl-2-C-methyl-D-erythritol kinase [Hyphomicrobiales bacterium]